MQSTPGDFPLSKIRTVSAAELCSHFDLSPQARLFLLPHITVTELLQSLRCANLWFDAVLLLAHAMYKRSAVWWLCVSLHEQIMNDELKAADIGATLKNWVRTPDEKNRQAAWYCCQKMQKNNPLYWAAMSVYWSEGDISQSTGKHEAPAPFLYARAVAAAIDSAASRSVHDVQRSDFYAKTLTIGVDIAGGGSGISLVNKAISLEDNK